VKTERDKLVKTGYSVLHGNDPEDDDDDDTATQEDKDAELANRLDPKSPDFIAPGNIYRVLAILHPGKIGFVQWGKYASKALICGYMQIFIPWKIIVGTFQEWEFEGIKSPLWFANNALTFASMCASLLSVCNLFAGKCAENIKVGQEANFFILSHEEPAGAAPAPASEEGSGTPLVLPKPTLPPWAISLNENFWCTVSLLLNIGMSSLLYCAMFLKIATFTGAVDQVAVVAVALYFIFDLDGKVMEADPKLKTRYRRAVVKQTVEKPNKPTYIRKIGNFAQTFIVATVPLGLIAIIMFGWKNPATGQSIGGDGITY
jgi:hypothetical protein